MPATVHIVVMERGYAEIGKQPVFAVSVMVVASRMMTRVTTAKSLKMISTPALAKAMEKQWERVKARAKESQHQQAREGQLCHNHQ